jgi:hypothetical protein
MLEIARISTLTARAQTNPQQTTGLASTRNSDLRGGGGGGRDSCEQSNQARVPYQRGEKQSARVRDESALHARQRPGAVTPSGEQGRGPSFWDLGWRGRQPCARAWGGRRWLGGGGMEGGTGDDDRGNGLWTCVRSSGQDGSNPLPSPKRSGLVLEFGDSSNRDFSWKLVIV